MGGSGGGGKKQPSLSEMEEAFDSNMLKGTNESTKRNAFISFAHEDLEQVNALRAQAKNKNSDIEFGDRSLHKPFDSKNAEYIKRGIRERIKQSSVTIVYLSNNSADSKWVATEIEMSINMGKKVVAMHSGNAPPTKLPSLIRKHKIRVVKWGEGELAKAIK